MQSCIKLRLSIGSIQNICFLIWSSQAKRFMLNQDSLCNIWRFEKKNIFVVIRSIKNIFSMKKVIITKCCPFKFWVFCLRPLPRFLVLIFWNLHCGEGVMKWKMLAGLKVSYDKFNKNYCIINEVYINLSTASSKDFNMNLM